MINKQKSKISYTATIYTAHVIADNAILMIARWTLRNLLLFWYRWA